MITLLLTLAASAGSLLCVQAVALRKGWTGLLMPWLRASWPRWGWLLAPGVVLWVGAAVILAVDGSGGVLAGVGLWAGASVGGVGIALGLASLRPIDPDGRFLDGAQRIEGLDVEPLDIPGEPDAGAVLLSSPPPSPPPSPAGGRGSSAVVGGGMSMGPAPSPQPSPAGGRGSSAGAGSRDVVILMHGGGNDRFCGLWLVVEMLLARGFAVLTAHLPGHGRGGQDVFDLERCRERVDALVRVARGRTAGRVMLVGQSMGGAMVLDHLARGGAIDAAVSVSAPASLRVRFRILRELGTFVRALEALRFGTPDQLLPAYGSFRRDVYPVRLAPGAPDYVETFARTIDAISLPERLRARAGSPLLVVHGRLDGVVPVAQAVALHEGAGAGSALMCVEGLHHLDVLLDPGTVGRIIDWLEPRSASVWQGGSSTGSNPLRN